jgi:3-oxoacyl-[acyl-carrier protein] reductase
MDLGINGKKALVCAASQGIGKAIAQALAREGASLFICARDEHVLKNLSNQLSDLSGQASNYFACDLTNEKERSALINKVTTDWGEPEILIHNIGGPAGTSACETTIDQWHSAYERLFTTVVSLNQAFVPAMKEHRWGRIIAVTSLAVLEPVPNLVLSNAMRSATTALLKTLSNEIASFGITVNCVAPGWIATERYDERIAHMVQVSGKSKEVVVNEILTATPAARIGSAEDFGQVVAFLCSQQANYITGSTICIDGGKRRSTY